MDATEAIKLFTEFMEGFTKPQIAEQLKKDEKFLIIDFFQIAQFSKDLAEDLLDNPQALRAAETALEALADTHMKVRIKNLPQSQKVLITDIRYEHINKLISVEGIIKGMTQVVGQVTSSRWECPACGNILNRIQTDKIFREPNRCGCGRQGKFILIDKEMTNAFSIMLEEAPDLLNNSNPNLNSIQIVFKDDMTLPKVYSRLSSGVRVQVNGIVIEFFKEKGNQKLNEVDWYIEANHLHIFDDDYTDMTITPEDEEDIVNFSNKADCFEVLAEQIFSDIEGLTLEKHILTLQAAGGSKFNKDKGTERGDIHILLIGDSGTAKTRMAKAVALISPKSRYVSGGSSSKVGLGAGVERDEILGRHYLVAGALPLSHKGICVLDEFDGFSDEDTKMLNEATEMQEIHVNKIVKGTFKTECSVLYCANPKGGKFDNFATISEQINIKPALISRCDAILLFRDIPEADKDARIARTMLKGKQQLKENLSLDFIRKYMMYIKRYNPEVPEDVVDYIVEAFVQIRQKGTRSEINNIPISYRDIMAVRRFATALARIKRMNKVTMIEAKKAMELKMFSLYQVAFDQQEGVLDTNRLYTSTTISEKTAMSLIEHYCRTTEYIGGAVDIEEMFLELQKENAKLDSKTFENALTKMRKEGIAFEPKRGWLKLII